MGVQELTDAERDVICHALGLQKRRGRLSPRWGYRNHFCAGAAAAPTWHGLVARGFAANLPLCDLMTGGDPVFKVTIDGARAAGLVRRAPRRILVKRAE